MKKRLPIGISDFKKMMNENYYYVDKTSLVTEVLNDGSLVIVLPRPRRFGKTLNLSMLRYFFEKSSKDMAYLFNDLEISKNQDYMEFQGKFPVIYLTFKDIKSDSWDKCLEKIKTLIIKEFERHSYLCNENILSRGELKKYNEILMGEATETYFESSLEILSEYLHRHYKEEVVILIDEYDMPIQNGYVYKYYDEIVNFMRNFLGAGLKDNTNLKKSIITGIMKVSKESIFSGLNNTSVYTLLSEHYSDKFGLIENEIEQIFKYYELQYELDEIKNWYNGYIFGNTIIYNPWSILNFLRDREFKSYWVNTSSNDLVRELITRGGSDLKQDLELLISGKSITKVIREDIVMNQIEDSTETIWSFLLFCGYLKIVSRKLIIGKAYCNLKIPNLEVKYLYNEIIMNWFSNNMTNQDSQLMLKSLVLGDIVTFEEIFVDYVSKSLSYFDVGRSEPEKFYHAFVLGLFITLNETHEIKSNRESGYGRYDVMIIPKDNNKLGIIIEFKKTRKNENLENAVDRALLQIEEKGYKQELFDRGIKDIIEIGIAFQSKNVLVKQKKW